MKKYLLYLKKYAPLSWRDMLVTLSALVSVSVLCILLRGVSNGDGYVPLLFVLAVLIVSLATDGYFFGILASLAAVVGVNYAFTYPYFAFNFTLSGYPLTFLSMLAVSVSACTLTSRLKRQELLRRESERELLRANLLRAISHDLRTPLTSIEGSVTAVLENPEALSRGQKQVLLAEARDSARWLIRMVENLLSITRMGADPSGAGIRKTPELAEEVIGEAVARFRKTGGIPVAVDVPAEPLVIPMDAMLVEQVLLNLLENASLHGGADAAEVQVQQGGKYAVFRVRDDGRGIDPARLPTLLQGYLSPPAGASADGDSRRNMGIGLSVCSSIITAHGGTLTAGNRSDRRGAEFSFTLPLDAAQE